MRKLGWLGSQTHEDDLATYVDLRPDIEPPDEPDEPPPPPPPTWILDVSYHGQAHNLSYDTEEDALVVYDYLTTTEDVWWFGSVRGRSAFAIRVASIDAVSIRAYHPPRY